MPPTLDIKTNVGVGYFGLLEIMNHLDSKGRLDKRDRQLLQQGYDLFYYYYYYHRTTTTQDHHQGKIIMLNSNPFISPASRQRFRSLECNLSSSLETHKMYLKISVILLQSQVFPRGVYYLAGEKCSHIILGAYEEQVFI